MSVFTRQTRMPVSQQELWAWHTRPGALQRLSPPFEGAEVESQFDTMALGAQTVLRVGLGPLKLRWVAEISGFEPPHMFQDTQMQGPFARWVHTHRMEAVGPQESTLEDAIEYELPVGALGKAFGKGVAQRKIENMFEYRHALTLMDLSRHKAFADRPRLTVAISGASGLIGSALSAFLTTGGHTVRRLSRQKPSPGSPDIYWNPQRDELDARALEGVDAVVHLAGESVAQGPWTAERRKAILESRVKGTRLLAQSLAKMEKPPRVFLSGSAIGYYGDRQDEELSETAGTGSGFLAEVCQEWEAATEAAQARGVRVAHLRLGIVLSSAGGALKTMLTPFRLGLGGRMGAGQQWMSWVSLEDVLGAIYLGLFRDDVSGAVNVVSPQPVRQAEFAQVLARVLERPAVMPAPSWALKTAMGDMAREMLLFSQRVKPTRLQAWGMAFQHPALEEALRFTLGCRR